MSYSFTVRASSKVSACLILAKKFDELVGVQPIRRTDIAAIEAAAQACVVTLENDPDHDIVVTCSGYADARHVSLNIRAGLAKRAPE